MLTSAQGVKPPLIVTVLYPGAESVPLCLNISSSGFNSLTMAQHKQQISQNKPRPCRLVGALYLLPRETPRVRILPHALATPALCPAGSGVAGLAAVGGSGETAPRRDAAFPGPP